MLFGLAEPFHVDVPHLGLVPVSPGAFVPIIHAGPSLAAPPHLEAPHAAFGPFVHAGLGGFATEPVLATGIPRLTAPVFAAPTFAAPTFAAPTFAAPAFAGVPFGFRGFPRFGFPTAFGAFPGVSGLGGFIGLD